MAPRKPKNPIQDIINTTSAWLGGNRGTINPQVARVSRDLGTAAQTIDAFTGGFGAAAGRDVRNFAQGGSLPTNLAKTAAVNLAAAAVGAKAAQVAGRAAQVVSRAASNRNTLPALDKKINKVRKVVKKTELLQEMGGYDLSTLKGRGLQALNDVRWERADRKLGQLETQQWNQINRALNVSPQKAGDLSSRNLSADMYERAVQIEKVMKQRNVRVPKKK